MPEQPTDPNAGTPGSPSGSQGAQGSSRRKQMTPALRRFLGPGRSWHDREAAKDQPDESAEPNLEAAASANVPDLQYSEQTPERPSPDQVIPPPVRSERRRPAGSGAAVVPDQKISRVLEMQTVALIFGGLILLGAAFYAGTKIRFWKAMIASRNKPEITNVDTRKFPGLTSEELVEQALAAERLGQWHESVERLLVAKRRNVAYRGLLFHAGKLCYDHGDFDSADRLLERSSAFAEVVDTSNYLRGLIAVGRNDLPAAQQLFEAAINAEPFTPGYYYYLGEALRRQNKASEAVSRYEQAASRTVNEQDAALCRFKARMAKAETADRAQLQTEVDQKRAAGPLAVDWLLTDAALKIRAGDYAEAAQLIGEARSSNTANLPTVFASCTADMLFTGAATNHPEIAAACRLDQGRNAAAAGPFTNP